MKKYVKPELFYERYELSQHIADCAWEMTLGKGACQTAEMEGMEGTLFTSDAGCFHKTDEGYEEYCYMPGANEDFKVFIS